MDIEEIKDIVKNKLSEKRYKHSICVMEMCEKLAKIYNVDIEMAKRVGIAHDVAKEMPKEEMISYCKQNNIQIDEIEMQNPGLLHGKIGADIAKKEFGYNKQMQYAIECHTTGKPNMDILAKILFVADAISDDRDWADIPYLRKIANENIDDAILQIIDLIIQEQIEKDKLIHLDGIRTRNELLKNKLNIK